MKQPTAVYYPPAGNRRWRENKSDPKPGDPKLGDPLMRILAITNLYPRPGHELIAPFNRQQFRALADNHALRVIAPVPWLQAFQVRSRQRLPAGLYTNADGVQVAHPIFYYPPRVMRSRAGQFFYYSIRECVQRALTEFQPDVLLACWAHPDGWAALRLAGQAGLRVVIKVIGSDVLVLPRDVRRRACVSEALRRADRIVAVSRDLAEHVERLGVDRRRIDVVPEGIDRNVFSPGEQDAARRRLGLPVDRPSILFVGNLLLSKGAGVLVEACRILKQEGTGAGDATARALIRGGAFMCHLVGTGRDESSLRSLIAKYRLSDCVKLVGACGHADLPDWYRASDVVALPSFSEGIPNVLREAIQCGRPFVATRVGGIPEIAHPSYSRLIERGDAAALARALAETLAATPRVDAALVRRTNISWQESAERLAESLAAPGPGRPRVDIHPAQAARSTRPPTRRRLRVLAITNQYPRLGNDAVAAFNRQQFRELAGLVDLRVVVPLRWPEVVREWASFDPRPRHFQNREGIWVDTQCFVYPPKLLLNRHGPLLLRSIRARVRRVLEEFRPDVLLGCWAYPDGWATVQLAQQAGLPAVIKAHGSDVLVLRHDARRQQLTQALSSADRVVVVSADLAEHVARLGASPHKIRHVPNGVDHELFRPGDQAAARSWLGLPPEGPMILFVGNILHSKGADLLVEACRHLRERGRTPHCFLVGKGRDAGRVAALIRRYDLAEQVRLIGGCVQEHLPAWYQACDVVALPSFSEGSPNVLHEAIACGRPFVATQVGGIPEIAHPSYSRLVPPGNAPALAAALDELLTAPPCVDANLVARHTVSWQESAEQLAEVLVDAVEGSQVRVQASAQLRCRDSQASALVNTTP